MDKIKLVLYGVRAERCFWERQLNEKYEIVGYSDADPIYSTLQTYDYRPFYVPAVLKYVSFDYILILPRKKSTRTSIFTSLIAYGIDVEKIIVLGDFASDFRDPIQEFLNLKRPFKGIVLGMSHAQLGFLAHYFSKSFFKFAAPSADLFFHYKVLKQVLSSEYLASLQYIVLELPYYIFNYDLSRCQSIVKRRMNYLEIFNDYHNYGKTLEERRNIRFYKIVKDMFGWYRNQGIISNNFEDKLESFSDDYAKVQYIANCHDHSWYDYAPNTIQENILIWNEILDLIYATNKKISVAVVVYPQHPLMKIYHNDAVTKMQDLFYQCIHNEKYNVLLYDFFDLLPEHSFIDQCHMNLSASIEFSQHLEKKFQQDYY